MRNKKYQIKMFNNSVKWKRFAKVLSKGVLQKC